MASSFLSPYRLAIVDLDDTLLGHDKEISIANLEALKRLRAAGMEIVVASGRHHDNIAQFEERIGVQGWVISSAGAMVRHAVTREILHELTVPVDLALEILQRGRDLGVSAIAYHRTGIFYERDSEWIRVDARKTRMSPQKGDLAALIRDGVQKLMWAGSKAEVDELYPKMEAEYGTRLYTVHTENELMEFLSPEANKARGAQVVAARLGIPREEVVAFGDGNNDVPVLTWAGWSVAMDHGRAAARKAAKLVTPEGPREEAFARGVGMVLGE